LPRQNDRYTRYRTPDCAACEQRPQCITSKQGRTLKRYPSEGAKETIRQAMADLVKHQYYRQRQAIVEPVLVMVNF